MSHVSIPGCQVIRMDKPNLERFIRRAIAKHWFFACQHSMADASRPWRISVSVAIDLERDLRGFEFSFQAITEPVS